MKSNIQPSSTLTAIEKKNITASSVKPNSTIDLKKVFIDELKSIYLIQRSLIQSFRRLTDKANSEQLADCIYEHMHETEDHSKRIEKLFSILGVNQDEIKKNEVVLTLLQKREIIIDKVKHGALQDIAIITACVKMKSYEIAAFGSLVSFAKTLGENEIAILLKDILNEKKSAEETLAEIKEYLINTEYTYEYTEKWQLE